MKHCKHFRLKNGSSQDQNLALTVLSVPDSLDRDSKQRRRSGQCVSRPPWPKLSGHLSSLPTFPALEREGNNLKNNPIFWPGNNSKGFARFRLNNSSSQGQKLAVTVLYVPNSLDSGPQQACLAPCHHVATLSASMSKVDNNCES